VHGLREGGSVPESLAELLHRFRSAAALSQETLAERAGLSTRTVSDIETGFAKTPRLVTIMLLAEALGLDDGDRVSLQEAARKAPSPAARGAGPPPLPPAQPLVGRTADAASASEVLNREGARLVTLCGPAGVGKTSLAIRIATECRAAFAGGAVFVELAAVADPASVPAAIARVLNVRESAGSAPAEALATWLRDRAVLLVLDNLEHLTPVAKWLTELLAACPGVKVLATSREALHVTVEQVFAVKPLDSASAVELFVSRAQAVSPNFVLSPANEPAIASIVQRLDGLPLAIELAAPRLRVLPPKALAARLDRRLPMLDEGSIDLPGRQQTMRTAIAWSYDLLTPDEQSLFRRLGVLSGGGSLAAARATAQEHETDSQAFLLRIAALVEKNLVALEEDAGAEPRLTMLGTLREFAGEQLDDAERATVRARHAAFFLDFAESAHAQLVHSEHPVLLARVEREQLNLDGALAWFAERGEGEPGLRLARALARFWWLRGHHTEGVAWFERFMRPELLEAVTPALRARGLRSLAVLHSALGNFDAALAPCEEAVRLQREIGEDADLCDSLTSLGILMQFRGDLDAATAAHEESLALRRGRDDELGVARSLSNLASVAFSREALDDAAKFGDESMAIYRRLGNISGMSHALAKQGLVATRRENYETAERLFEESLALQRSLGNDGSIFYSLGNLGEIAYRRGDVQLAIRRYREALDLLEAVPNKAAIASVLESLAAALTASNAPRQAARIFGATDALRQTIGSPRFPADRAAYGVAIAATRAALGEALFDTEWQMGTVMSLARTLEEARGGGTRERTTV
jgi:predicted ATPase/transcriptional regulator with XRE-family HTH domain